MARRWKQMEYIYIHQRVWRAGSSSISDFSCQAAHHDRQGWQVSIFRPVIPVPENWPLPSTANPWPSIYQATSRTWTAIGLLSWRVRERERENNKTKGRCHASRSDQSTKPVTGVDVNTITNEEEEEEKNDLLNSSTMDWFALRRSCRLLTDLLPNVLSCECQQVAFAYLFGNRDDKNGRWLRRSQRVNVFTDVSYKHWPPIREE